MSRIEQKLEKKATTTELERYVEYSLEDLSNVCNNRFDELKKQYKESPDHKWDLTRFTLEVDSESDYDGGSYPIFNMHLYRMETDQEFKSRINAEKAKKQAALKTIKAKKEREEKQKLLEKDPDYQLFQKLKDKFKN